MEIQKVPGLDFGDLVLIPGVVIPHKFKVLNFSKYDGVSYPKLYPRLYVRKIQPVVPQNFPSHISQNISRKILKMIKEVQELTRQALS